jgi:hypothetical protein
VSIFSVGSAVPADVLEAIRELPQVLAARALIV